ncbi:WecB/TagA/CpsF family glycosyltransferase [Rhodococcus hoagii]|uniref:WecB/TagA/CpsF family glycosyltransferase n=1 Tax=Rhodococcus hoagii TaxID=43767 RepID=UPI000A11EC22|nr:WecB/TagA/CpsF family glycosyltransferase [Prescottella equi]NKR53534.1 WecB/TagA/CpsF family glycosyltransferase [Prescottella equi]NKR64679.1 WecB/TagA/CpsF family glycosyltransferase [Prescottella equi]NKR78379.1 WecB/TagA/CpsF family glycosyltransferase [Prescottella equi]NKS58868.1 WecB/TagA/CpsF family glycosyltransferase [Prescottella equi]NKT02772.1 WecB/TagA/CpsF family glycosyltransferase [Prescottella equi]
MPSSFDGAVATIIEMARGAKPYLVVTPNIAHVKQVETCAVLQMAYDRADFSPPDGWPVVSAVRYLTDGALDSERVPGSDLLIELCKQPVSVCFVGGAGDSAALAAENLTQVNESLDVVSIEPAPRNELEDQTARRKLVARIAAAQPEIIFVGLGVPRQESLALELLEAIDRGVVLCVGASIEFAAGTLKRAPLAMQNLKLEWLHRLATEPRKLARRYAQSAPHFIKTVVAQRRLQAKQGRSMTECIPPELDRLIVHQFDPVNPSPGGIDTCLRGICKYFPDGVRIGIVGIDGAASETTQGRVLGRWEKHVVGDRQIWFLPVARLDPGNQRRVVPHSLRLVLGVMKYRRRIPSFRLLQAHRMDTAAALKPIFRRPLAYFVHTQDSGLTGETSDSIWRYASKIHAAMEHHVVRRADDVVVFNPDYAAQLGQHNPSTIFSPTWFDPSVVQEISPARDQHRVLWVGRVEEPKDPMLAIETFVKLATLGDEWKLDVVGGGTLLPAIVAKVQSMPEELRSRVTVHGRLSPDEVARVMAECSVFLMTSHAGYEGYPRVLVESLASGLSAVVTEGADTGRLIVDGTNGYTVRQRDPRLLAEAIVDSLSCDSKAAIQTVASLQAPVVIERIFNASAA